MTGTHTLVLGWAGSTNLGDELIVRAVADLVMAAGGQPTVVTVDPEQSAELQVPLVRHAGAFETVALAAAAGRHTAAVFGGGGLIQDETGPLNLPFHLTRLTVARARRLPWAGLALGFGAVRRRSSRLLVRALLRGSVAMSVRDEASVQRCRDLTGLTPLLAADPVLGTTTDTVAPTDHPHSYSCHRESRCPFSYRTWSHPRAAPIRPPTGQKPSSYGCRHRAVAPPSPYSRRSRLFLTRLRRISPG